MRKKSDEESELIKWSARDERFEFNGNEVNVEEYFKERHDIILRYPDMPIILCGRLGYFPIEFLHYEADRLRDANEKIHTESALAYYDEFSGAKRIEHIKEIRKDVDRNEIVSEKVLPQCALEIETENAVFPARRLCAPKLEFGENEVVRPQNGSFNLNGKKFKR